MTAKILVVDDEIYIRQVLEIKLKGQGYTVQSCISADAALGVLDTFVPDLIITDYRMPGEIDGLGLVEGVRRSPQLSSTPIILLSGSVAIMKRLENEFMGTSNLTVMTKPFSPRRLIARVRDLLEACCAERVN